MATPGARAVGANGANVMVALDAQSGQCLWSKMYGFYAGFSSPIVVDGRLYTYDPSGGGQLYAFHLPGKGAHPYAEG